MSLTYDKLIDLAGGLGVKVADLFQEDAMDEDQTVVMGRREIGRNGEGFHLETKNYDYHYLCPELKSKKLTPILGRIRSRSTNDFEGLFKHEGEEFNYVVEGAIEVHTEFYSPVRLEQGDYIYLDSTMPHGFISVSKKPALVLSICTSPTGKAMDQDAVVGDD
jgi:mannose-6-phosphate isomerase-like protein (cupin superfamily)